MAEKPANQPPLRLAGPQKSDKQVRDAARIGETRCANSATASACRASGIRMRRQIVLSFRR